MSTNTPRTVPTAMPSTPEPQPDQVQAQDQDPDHDALLVSAQWLQARLQQASALQPGLPVLRILDCSTYMTPQPVGPSKISSGRADYLAGHIPGALHVDMAQDLSDPSGAYPYTLLSVAAFDALMQRLGIGRDDHVVVYGRSAMVTVTRAWFVLHAMGHARVSVLDGGFAAWQALGGPLSQTAPQPVRSVYRAQPLRERVASLAQVRAALHQPQVCLANALSRAQFEGSGGAHYGRPGRLPGSVSLPAAELLVPDSGLFRPLDSLRADYAAAGALQADEVITYCGGGIAATATAFTLQRLGQTRWSVYDNSLLEWSTLDDTPMVQGPASS